MFYKQVHTLSFPVIGLGSFGINDERSAEIIDTAVTNGVSYIDSAERYGNERVIGATIEKYDISRGSIIVGTKLSYRQQISGTVFDAVNSSLQNLALDYIDLYFIHSPKSGTYCSNWIELQTIKASGKIRELGVSNFNSDQLDELYKASGIYPVINQIEVHLGCYPKELISYCRTKGIIVQASCPLGRMNGGIANNPCVQKICKRYKKTFPQISLRWLIQHDILMIPKTQSKEHLSENLAVFDFQILNEDMMLLDNLSVCNAQ